MYAIFRSKNGTFSVAFSAAWSYISYILDVQSFTSLAHKWFRDDIREKLWIQFSGNLLMKLAGSTWGASANTLWSSALALCYSAAEYCAPVWSRSAHTSRVDVQLNSTMRLISGTLCSTPLPWLPVLSNIELPALRRKAATDKLVEKMSNMTVGQSSLISSAHHCCDWHPGNRCGWTCNQLTS